LTHQKSNPHKLSTGRRKWPVEEKDGAHDERKTISYQRDSGEVSIFEHA
jgi:hypothetical protein